MSNDKAEATYHGRPRAYLVDDRVRLTRLPQFERAPGRIALVGDAPMPYLVQLANGQYVHADWLMLEPDPLGSTGEQIKAKYVDTAGDYGHGYIRTRRSWTPTPGEIGLALGIVAFIVVLFVFFVAFYPGR